MTEITNKKNNILIPALISLFAGAFIFILIYGIDVINPLNDDWIKYQSHIKQHYIGWEFYRNAPWTFPIGLYNTLSFPIYTSIINTDSIPLFAVLFKILSPILPQKFQYFGLWGILCFMLQSLLGMIIIKKYTKNSISGYFIAILCGILFVLVPVLYLWMFEYTALCAHWVILLSIIPLVYNDRISLRNKIMICIISSVLAASIHPYLVIMCGLTVFGEALLEFLNTKDKKSFVSFAGYLIFSTLILYSLGGFEMNFEVKRTIIGELYSKSFDLNGLFNPFYTSKIFNQINSSYEMFEKYAYMGAGIIVLVGFSLVLLIQNIVKKNFKLDNLFITYLIIMLLSFVLANSPLYTICNHKLFLIPLPDFILEKWAIFRATGRYIYVLFYILVIWSLSFLIKNLKQKTAAALIIFCILVQMYDIHSFAFENSKKYKIKQKYALCLGNLIWEKIARNNDVKVIYFDKKHMGKCERGEFSIYEISQWAYENEKKISDFMFSRDLKDSEISFINNALNDDYSGIFILMHNSYNDVLIKKSALEYFYYVDGVVIASKKRLQGLENIEHDKKQFLENKILPE